ncbi:hypothetical protein [Hydrogenophaga sp. BPS33]|uniref:hypothetical protein n=1 Tax=Hydrogenophaga sp. BPS33 TaxID=2651974 RepID=UPI00131FD52E|nr:hypothetical protein [Hydrogenophaga sp. BPS33]QHE87209.1 ATP-binding protein [Hydrogenophaga sp. BPS33]
MGQFNASAVAGFLKKMWDNKARRPEDCFLLVLESGVDERSSTQSSRQNLNNYPKVLAALKGRRGLAADVARTEVYVLPSPRTDALLDVSAIQQCTLQEADLYFSDLLGIVGAAADDNGMRAPEDYRGLAVSDVQQRFDSLRPLLSSALVEEALTTGLCVAVDFLTADEDRLFYMGVDAQASHVAAGLVVERPELRAAAMDGLNDRRNVLIHGPSGSGKSAILWDVAYYSRHSVRWFQIRQLTLEDVGRIAMLARSRRASLDAPIGFIIDDVGRGFSDAWTALAEEVRRTPGLLLLGSVREEDRYPLEDRGQAHHVQVESDAGLAERIWKELRERGQTSWQGWREPWVMSNGHLLEYTHILTQGRRLSETLDEQVSARQNDRNRHDELDVLRVVACANATGCSAEVVRLPEVLGKSSSNVSLALTRLIDEHMVFGAEEGQVVGLHELRSAEILRLSHRFPPPLMSSTVAAAVYVVPGRDLGRFLERTLTACASYDEALLEAVSRRVMAEPSAIMFSQVVKGLDLAQAHRIVRDWLASPEASGIPRAHLGLAGIFGVSGVDAPVLGGSSEFAPASRRLTELRNASALSSLTQRLIALLGVAGIRSIAAAGGTGELTLMLASLNDQALPDDVVEMLSQINPPTRELAFGEVVELLAAAHAASPLIARRWVDRVSQDELFARFAESVAWTSVPTLSPCEEGIEVRANFWAVVSEPTQDANDAAVRTVETLLAIAPDADIGACDVLGADGRVQMMSAGRPSAQKRIPRRFSPGSAAVSSNRRWLQAVSSHLSSVSRTAYLSQFLDHIRVVNRCLKIYLDAALRGREEAGAIATLGKVHEASLETVPPPELNADGTLSQRYSTLQSLLFDCSAELLRRFAGLPEESASYIGWVGSILDNVKSAVSEESWDLIGTQAPGELMEWTRILEGMQALAREASVRQRSPIRTHTRHTAKKGALFDGACRAAATFKEARVAQVESALRSQLCSAENGRSLYLLDSKADSLAWPPADVLLVLPADGISDLSASWADFRAALGEGRRICILPVLDGYGLTLWAVAGHEVPFAAQVEALKWCEVAGVRALPTPTVDAFTAVTRPLIELNGVDAYWSFRGRRIAQERTAYDQLRIEVDHKRTDFGTLPIQPEVMEDAERTFAAILNGELNMAADAARVLAGERSEAVMQLEQLTATMMAQDALRVVVDSDENGEPAL